MAALVVVAAVLAMLAGPAHAELVSHWALDEATGTTAVDSSANGNNATFNSGTPGWTGGYIGGAVNFPGGSSNFFNTATLDELAGSATGLTVSAWISPDSNAAYRGILTTRDAQTSIDPGTSTGNWGIAHEGSHIDARVQTTATGSSGLDTADVIPTNAWTHVVMTWNASDGARTVYLNGTPAVSDTISAGTSWINGGVWRIGQDNDTNRVFDGLIDDPTVWNEALTASQVATVYNAGLHGTNAGAAFAAGSGERPTAKVLADSQKDWEGHAAQPHGDWRYGRYNGAANWNSFAENTNAGTYYPGAPGSSWIGGNGDVWNVPDYPQLGEYSQAPSNGDWAVRRWTSDVDGEVTVFYDAMRLQTGSSGQIAGIYLNGQPLRSMKLSNSNYHEMGSIGVTVQAGDHVDFIVDSRGYNNSDWTHFTGRVELGPPHLNPGLVAHWALDETSVMPFGNPNNSNTNRRAKVGDWTGNNHHMSTHNTWSSERVPGLINNALEFHNGTGYGVSGATDIGDGASELTLSMWIRPDGKSNWDGLLTSASGGFTGMALADYNSQGYLAPTFRVMNAGNVTSTIDTPVGEWSHVVAVWKSGEMHRIYINGQLGANNDAQAYAGLLGIDQPWYIGRDRLFTDRWFDGLLDDVGIWERALTEDEISTIYGAGLKGIDLAHAAASVVPEPSSFVLAALGLLAVVFCVRRRKR
ncbi:MAG: PEP-CTERM sorting domain-containing protein [Planctomycetes bacterium]|nr:PEP-CTERM sorting domain-containing protein [Planctomycetota bacterium]